MVFKFHFGNRNPSNEIWLRSLVCETVQSGAHLFEAGVWSQAASPLACTTPESLLKAGQKSIDWVSPFISQVRKQCSTVCLYQDRTDCKWQEVGIGTQAPDFQIWKSFHCTGLPFLTYLHLTQTEMPSLFIQQGQDGRGSELIIIFVLFLCNKLPQTLWLEQHPFINRVFCSLGGLSWVLCAGSHKAEIKVFAGLHYCLKPLKLNLLWSSFRWLAGFSSLWLQDWNLCLFAGCWLLSASGDSLQIVPCVALHLSNGDSRSNQIPLILHISLVSPSATRWRKLSAFKWLMWLSLTHLDNRSISKSTNY